MRKRNRRLVICMSEAEWTAFEEKVRQSGINRSAFCRQALQDMEVRAFVTCLNCREESAAEQFMETKRLWGKTGGRLCYHGYQSFAAGEVTARQAHDIGVKLAKELWGDRFEVIVATHCNTGHYHNHLVINSVSWRDGYKFINSKADYRNMRTVSDRLCREAGLQVTEQPADRGQSYAQWDAERRGKSTRFSVLRADIDRAVASATTSKHFMDTMSAMGYTIRLYTDNGAPLRHPTIRPPDSPQCVRLHRLGASYTWEEIMDRVYENERRQIPFPEAERSAASRIRRQEEPPRGHTLQVLLIRYRLELRILRKYPASVRRVSVHLREDVRKLDRIDRQVQLLTRESIDTLDQLNNYRNGCEKTLQDDLQKRQQLHNTLRRAAYRDNPAAAEPIRAQSAELTREIVRLRRDIGLCVEIARRSAAVAENLSRLDTEHQKQEEIAHESIHRGGRSGRPDDTQRR